MIVLSLVWFYSKDFFQSLTEFLILELRIHEFYITKLWKCMHATFCPVAFLPFNSIDVREWTCCCKPLPLLLRKSGVKTSFDISSLSLDSQKNFLGSTSKVKMYNFIFIKFCCIIYFLYGDNAHYTVIWKWVKSIFYLISLQPCWYNWVIKMNPPFFKGKTLTTETYKCSFPNAQRKGTSRARVVYIFKFYILTCSKPCLFERNFPIFLHSSDDWMGQCFVPRV